MPTSIFDVIEKTLEGKRPYLSPKDDADASGGDSGTGMGTPTNAPWRAVEGVTEFSIQNDSTHKEEPQSPENDGEAESCENEVAEEDEPENLETAETQEMPESDNDQEVLEPESDIEAEDVTAEEEDVSESSEHEDVAESELNEGEEEDAEAEEDAEEELHHEKDEKKNKEKETVHTTVHSVPHVSDHLSEQHAHHDFISHGIEGHVLSELLNPNLQIPANNSKPQVAADEKINLEQLIPEDEPEQLEFQDQLHE